VVRFEYEEQVYTGRGVSTDVIEASIKAYISCWNNFLIRQQSISKVKISL